MPFTPAAKKVLELSLREAVSSGCRVVTPEHLLCGLLRVEDGMAVRVLADLNVDRDETRQALASMRPVPVPPGPPVPRASQPRPVFIRSDETVSRVIEACVENAIDDDRGEYALVDLLEAIADDPTAAAEAAALGLDLGTLRRREQPDTPEAATG